ncbi:MAG: protein translocase subunit SecF [Thermomicrobiales bacterium]
MLDLVGKRNLWFLLSALFLVPGFISLIFNGLELGIDFTGGTNWDLQFEQPVNTDEISQILDENGFGDNVVQLSDDNTVIIRMAEMKEGSPEKDAIESDFIDRFGQFEELSIVSVGPSAGQAIRDRAVLAVVLASVGILLYIAFAFRNTNNPLLYGFCAILAMLHDAFFVLGVFSILGWLADVEVDALFVTALLTVIGFSVHDSIVVFDRIRENLAARLAPTFDEIVNYSIVQTLVRSINTSLTVVLTLAALWLFGGETTRWFVFALLIGVVAGTYSSIFNAAQILVAWESGDIKRAATFWRRDRVAAPETGAAAHSR